MPEFDVDVLYVLTDEHGFDSAAIVRLSNGHTRFVIYSLDDHDSTYVDMTDEVVRQVQAALGVAISGIN